MDTHGLLPVLVGCGKYLQIITQPGMGIDTTWRNLPRVDVLTTPTGNNALDADSCMHRYLVDTTCSLVPLWVIIADPYTFTTKRGH